MKQYKYQYILTSSNTQLNDEDIERLNKLGQEGWGTIAKYDCYLLLQKEIDLDTNL